MVRLSRERAVFWGILVVGLAVAAAFHSSGALDTRDALIAAALRGGVTTSPPLPLTSRLLEFAVHFSRLVHADTGLFRAMHLAGGILVAIAVACSAIVMVRAARARPGAGLAGALLLVGAIWFGADSGRLALTASPLPVVLALSSLAALAWTRPAALAFWGGLAAGLAFAEHPLVAFLLPGFLALLLSATLRVPPDGSGRLLARAAGGFLLGACAILGPLVSPRSTVIGAPAVASVGDAITLWWGSSEPFWRFAAPSWWPANVARHVAALARNAGPVVLLLAIFGAGAFLRGRTPLLRPFLLLHAGIAFALVFGHVDDARLAYALAAWTLVPWCVSALSDAQARRPRLGSWTWVPAVASAAVLLAMNHRLVDRSTERGVAWAEDALLLLPEPSVLITANPVHVALAAWNPRNGVDVIYRGTPHTRALEPGDRGLLPFRSSEELRGIVESQPEERTVLIEPNLFFDTGTRVTMLAGVRKVVPWGLCFEIVPMTRDVSRIATSRGSAWESFDVTAEGPPLGLRDGLTPAQFYARSLAQSAATYLDLDLEKDAEREFLLAATHPDANPTLVAYGFGQLLFEKRNFAECARVLETFVRDGDAGAVQALTLLGGVHQQLSQNAEAITAFRRAARLLDAQDAERASLEERIRRLESREKS